jgi:hypothetical protein
MPRVRGRHLRGLLPSSLPRRVLRMRGPESVRRIHSPITPRLALARDAAAVMRLRIRQTDWLGAYAACTA